MRLNCYRDTVTAPSRDQPGGRRGLFNPKLTEISGEIPQEGGKGKMQSEEIMREKDVDGELKAELAAWKAV